MRDIETWDWQVGKKVVADLASWREVLSGIEELAASPDGEKIAALGKAGDGEFAVGVNGQVLPARFELGWYLRFTPLGQLIALVRIDDEWTVCVDGEPWEERFE